MPHSDPSDLPFADPPHWQVMTRRRFGLRRRRRTLLEAVYSPVELGCWLDDGKRAHGDGWLRDSILIVEHPMPGIAPLMDVDPHDFIEQYRDAVIAAERAAIRRI